MAAASAPGHTSFPPSSLYQNPPDENPPGGTRPRASPFVAAGLFAGSLGWLGGADLASSFWMETSSRIFSTTLLGSVEPMQALRFEEFCWLYLARGAGTATSGSEKILVCPPPGGFSTRLEGRALVVRPIFSSVDVILSLLVVVSVAAMHNNEK